MVTRKQINKILPEGYTIEGNYNDEGCYYFIGNGEYGDTANWYCSSVYVYRLNHLTLDQWLESFIGLASEYSNK